MKTARLYSRGAGADLTVQFFKEAGFAAVKAL
jgi:hypothetical protein